MNQNGSKARNVRKVIFSEDYPKKPDSATANWKPTYKKGSVHAMHNQLAVKLKEKGVNVKIETIDIDKMTRDRKRSLEAANN